MKQLESSPVNSRLSGNLILLILKESNPVRDPF